MAIITKPTISKGQANEIDLSKSDLAAVSKVVNDSYFSDQTNWSKVIIQYKSAEGNQHEMMIFDASETSPKGNFEVSEKARDNWEVQSVKIMDFDGGYLKLQRGDLTVADFDISLGQVSGGLYFNFDAFNAENKFEDETGQYQLEKYGYGGSISLGVKGNSLYKTDRHSGFIMSPEGLDFSSEMTISFWHKMSNITDAAVFSIADVSPGQYGFSPSNPCNLIQFGYYGSNKDYSFVIAKDQSIQSAQGFNVLNHIRVPQPYEKRDTWVKVDIVLSNSGMKLYIDGQLEGTKLYPSSDVQYVLDKIKNSAESTFLLGNSVTSARTFATTYIDEFKIVYQALTDEEIFNAYTEDIS